MRFTHFASLVSCVFLLSSSASNAAFTYWFHATCTTTAASLPSVMTELLELCAMTNVNMQKTLPSQLAIPFELLFSQSKNSGAKNSVQDILSGDTYNGGLCALKETTNREASDIRIYCDDDPQGKPTDRWTIVPDKPGDPNPNSKRKRIDQDWEDKVDEILMNKGSEGCKQATETGELITEGELHSGLPAQAVPGQSSDRVTITICQKTLQNPRKTLKDWTDANLKETGSGSGSGSDTDDPNLDLFKENFPLLVLYHELMHFRSWYRADVKMSKPEWGKLPSNAGAFGWDDIINLLPNQKILNADNHAYWALLNGLSQAGWHLVLGESNEGQATATDDTNQGFLVQTKAQRLRKRRRAVFV